MKEGSVMIEMLKNLFSKKQEEHVPDPPGRTFNRVLTGRFFGCEDKNADEESIAQAKQDKIDQIQELELKPMFVRFTYKDTSDDNVADEARIPISAHVAFQKEVFAEKWNMIHVTEISFTVDSTEFEEFEKMARVSLKNDFRDLTNTKFAGKDRRKERRD